MIARSFCNFCYAHGVGLGGMIKQNHEETVLDEGLSYLFAGLGFYFQFMIGFKVPGFLNLIFWPFNFAEVCTDCVFCGFLEVFFFLLIRWPSFSTHPIIIQPPHTCTQNRLGSDGQSQTKQEEECN